MQGELSTVYRMITSVLIFIFVGLYVFPFIDPPPEIIDQLPFCGVPVKDFVSEPRIDVVDVVFFYFKSVYIHYPTFISLPNKGFFGNTTANPS